MRAFVAITLPASVRTSLTSLQRELGESGADVKWVAEAQLHVTLKFLDEIDDAARQAVEQMLRRVAGREGAFALSVSEVGAFPSVRSPRVVWVGLAEGKETVTRIAQVIETEGRELGVRREERPLAAHITLGRVRSPKRRDQLAQRLGGVRWQPSPPWRATSLTLYQSVLTPAGAQYTVLADAPLRD